MLTMPHRYGFARWYLVALLAANLALLLPNASPLRVLGALLLIGLLPGLGWANRLLPNESTLLRVAAGAALSFTVTNLATLLLHYLPGPVFTWHLLLALNLLAIIPLVTTQRIPKNDLGVVHLNRRGRRSWGDTPQAPRPAALFDSFEMHPNEHSPAPRLPIRPLLPLLLILIVALFLRGANLHYSEFQGDEALAMISAAEALEGHDDALFLRSKGPGEVLLPMALWRLTGTITEAVARLPFTLAALLAIVTIYLIGKSAGGDRVGWLAAGFFALNGFMVAFGRIVQYQALVVWLSALAVLMAIRWQATRQHKYTVLSGLFLGTGLLAHYDAILALPAVGWLLVTTADSRPRTAVIFSSLPSAVGGQWVKMLQAVLFFAAALLLTALPFYLPYALDPQANRTGAYVGQRIGSTLRNNLPDFFHFNTFYSSSYYLIVTGVLVLGVVAWLLWKARWSHWAIPVIAVVGILAVIFNPNLLTGSEQRLNLAIIPFGLALLGAFVAIPFTDALAHESEFNLQSSAKIWQGLIAWLAVPFLGYNFVVALGLTHIYTIVPAWSLLAALGWNQLTINNTHRALRDQSPISNLQSPISNLQSPISNLLISTIFLLCTVFLWNAFVRHDVEYWQDYPAGNLPIFWTPYREPPQAGFFGFAHRAGWKAVGQKIAAGELRGDYGSNEEPDVTTWYTRGAPRACDPRPEFYFLAGDLIDPIPVPNDVIGSHYQQIGSVTLPNQKQMQIMQLAPVTKDLGQLNEPLLASQFDQTATPAAFARSARGSQPAQANFGNLVRLIGYDLDTRRAYPGGRVPVTLYWQVLAPFPTGYQVFTHLEGEGGPVAQSDGVPVCWTYPTDDWRPGQIIADQHAIALSPDTPPGNYPLEIGLYLPDTFDRLNVLDRAGNPAGTSVTLDIVEIRQSGD